MECYETVQAVVDSQLRNGGNQKHYDKLQNVGAGRHQPKKGTTMPTVKVKISCGYTDYLNIEIRADDSVAEALLEAVTALLAKTSSKQLTPPKANRKE